MAELPRWPARIGCLCRELRDAPGSAPRRALQAELWVLLHMALHRHLCCLAPRFGRFVREDLEDLAAQKSLELLRRAECGSWEPSDRAPGEVVAYLSNVARNGLVDYARRGRSGFAPHSNGSTPALDGPDELESECELPETCVEREEFVAALVECTGRLGPKARTIWLFRALYDMASKDIARHPEIALKPSHVDVVLQRCREAVGACMKRKGHATAPLPPGTFLELWARYRMEPGPEPVVANEALDAG